MGRAAFAEAALANAAALGAEQYLILGAGYDTFAYRQPAWAEKLTLFELDRPLISYGLLLLSLVWLLALGWDLLADVSRFGKYWRGQQAASGSPAERYLQEKVQQLEAQNKLLQEQQLQAKTELDDYYTLWAHQMKIPIAAS